MPMTSSAHHDILPGANRPPTRTKQILPQTNLTRNGAMVAVADTTSTTTAAEAHLKTPQIRSPLH